MSGQYAKCLNKYYDRWYITYGHLHYVRIKTGFQLAMFSALSRHHSRIKMCATRCTLCLHSPDPQLIMISGKFVYWISTASRWDSPCDNDQGLGFTCPKPVAFNQNGISCGKCFPFYASKTGKNMETSFQAGKYKILKMMADYGQLVPALKPWTRFYHFNANYIPWFHRINIWYF